jgi:hypothetical protein
MHRKFLSVHPKGGDDRDQVGTDGRVINIK